MRVQRGGESVRVLGVGGGCGRGQATRRGSGRRGRSRATNRKGPKVLCARALLPGVYRVSCRQLLGVQLVQVVGCPPSQKMASGLAPC